MGQRAVSGKRELLVFAVLFAAILAAFALSLIPQNPNANPSLITGLASTPESTPALLQPYARKPETGTMVALPTAPVIKAPPGSDALNLVSNSGFEYGSDMWETNSSAASSGSTTNVVAARGERGFQLLSNADTDATVFQSIRLKPRTLYMLGALVFAPGPSETILFVQDAAGGTGVSSPALQGPLQTWSYIHLIFVSGATTGKASVGVRSLKNVESAPVVVDECSVYALAAEEYLPDGNMETAPQDDRAPVWYFRGNPATRVQEGYQSEYALEMSAHSQHASTLFGLVPRRAEFAGKTLWISAMIKCIPDGTSPPPEIQMQFQTTAADGSKSKTSADVHGTGDWIETTLSSTLPDVLDVDSTDALPFDVLRFTCPAGTIGRILIDEVIMLVIPHNDFGGGLSQAVQLP